jgi:hypothetical protein
MIIIKHTIYPYNTAGGVINNSCVLYAALALYVYQDAACLRHIVSVRRFRTHKNITHSPFVLTNFDADPLGRKNVLVKLRLNLIGLQKLAFSV